MAHIEDLQVFLGDQIILDWLNVSICKMVTDEVELTNGHDEEKI